jgi:chromosome segregation ATPase
VKALETEHQRLGD